MFTCVTDTGQLQWVINGYDAKIYYSPNQVNEPAITDFSGIFVLKLINVNANELISSATAHNASLNNDGVNITCIDDVNNPEVQNNSVKDSIMIGIFISYVDVL